MKCAVIFSTASCLIMLLAGCNQHVEKMSEQEYSTLINSSIEELKLKTAGHQAAWGFGKFDRWSMNLDEGILIFSNLDGTTARCPAQIIGTFDSQDNTWLWSWDNPSVPDRLKKDALQVRNYGGQHGLTRLTTAKWPATESNAWEMTALATRLCGAEGAYRGPAGETFVFITFGKVELSGPKR
jgi:hypothetical protein